MKPVNTATGLSPPSTASPAGGVIKSSSLPISRSNVSAWEKPERARTSHACEPCRERKTKCDGERPSCRRCLHTGTSCHYGYGKGWRKRKTAEDLTATSRRLARYESLLNEIFPMVSAEVRALIEEARDQDATTPNGSETTDPDHGYAPPHLIKPESNLTGTGSRMLLPLPVPSPLASTVSRSSTSSGTYDSVPPAAGPQPPTTVASAPPVIQASQQRLSPDATPVTRLPSITPDGLLIETRARERSSPKLQHLLDSTKNYGQDRLGALPTSPNSHTFHGGWLSEPYPGRLHADNRKRDYEAAVFPWLKSNQAETVQN